MLRAFRRLLSGKSNKGGGDQPTTNERMSSSSSTTTLISTMYSRSSFPDVTVTDESKETPVEQPSPLSSPEGDSSSSSSPSSFFHTIELSSQADQDQIKLKELFQHILAGNMARVKSMLEVNPALASLPFNTNNTDDQYMDNLGGQLIYIQGKTAYQLALGEEDMEMAALLKTNVEETKGIESAYMQYYQQFPKGWEQDEEIQWQDVFRCWNALTLAIDQAAQGDILSSGATDYKIALKAGSEVETACTNFNNALVKIRSTPVKTGRHYNPKLLYQAFQKLDADWHHRYEQNQDNPKAQCYWQYGIGSIEHMPAHYTQACHDTFKPSATSLKLGTDRARSLQFRVYHPETKDHSTEPFSNVQPMLGKNIAFFGQVISQFPTYASRGYARPLLEFTEINNDLRLAHAGQQKSCCLVM